MSDHANSSSGLPRETPGAAARYGWAGVPIPLLLLTIVALWIADLRTPYESRALMVTLNVVFTWLVSLCICILTARGFLASGQPGLLMFGCGSLVWGATSLAAAVIVDRVNPTITVHNVGVLSAAFCHVAGLLWLGRLARPVRWLVAGYAGALLIAALIFWAATAGWTPVFFVQGQGGTAVRQTVLLLAVVLFAWVAWQMLSKFRRHAGDFYYWYGLGLALTATGLTGVFSLTVQGGILGWTNRLTQYLGCAYLFVAAMAAVRETGSWRISLAAVEEAWRRGELLPALRKEPMLRPALRYGFAVVIVAAALALRQALTAWVGPGLPPYITFYPAVAVVALMAGLGPALLATALTSGIAAYWFFPPVGQFAIASPVDRLALIIFIGMGVFMGAVAELYRRNRQKVADYEREAALRESREALRRHAELIDPIRAELITQEMQRVVRERGAAVAAPPSKPVGDSLRRVAVVTGAIVAGVGLLVFIGWILGLDAFKSVLPGLATMKANTALCFLLAGAALLLLRPGAVAAVSDRRNESANGTDGGPRPPLQWAGMAAAVVVLLVAGLTMLQYVTGADFGIDQLLFRDTHDPHTIFPGRMVEATALAFLFTGASLLLLGARSRTGRRTQQTLAVCAGVIGVIAVLGYAYNVQQLYRFAGYSSMALHTALSFLALAVGLIFTRPDGLARLLAGSGPAALLARRLLPVALLAPAVLGWLVERALKHGLFGEGMDIAMLTLAMMLSLAAMVWWTVRALHRADATRRENETQLRNQAEVMDQAHDALIVREMDGVIRSWNRGAEKLYGWSAAEAVGQDTHTLLQTPASAVQEFETTLEQTGHWEGELLHITRDGRRVTVESRKTATRTADGRVLVLESNRDITARKQADTALRESERFVSSVAAASPHLIYVFDLERMGVTYVSRPLLGELGYPMEMAERVTRLDAFRDYMEPEEMPHLSRLLDEWRTLPEGHLRQDEYRLRHADGTIRSFAGRELAFARRPDGSVWQIIGSLVDITERKQAEEALRAKEADLTEAQRVAHIGSWQWDAKTDVTIGSDELLRIYGFDPATQTMPDFRGQRGRCYPVEDWERINAAVQRTLETGVGYELDARVIRNGTTIWVTTRGEVVRDATGQIVGLRGTVQDITARKQAEEALREAHDSLEQRVQERTAELSHALEKLSVQAEQLRSLASELTLVEQRERVRLAEVIHDGLQQLLVAARVRVHMLGRVGDPTARQVGEEISGLLGDALADARSLTAELSPPILRTGGLRAGLDWLTRWSEEKHHFAVRVQAPAAPPPPLPEDLTVLLFQAVRELLFNAVKYAQVFEATVTLAWDARGLTLTVADAGVGFDPTGLRGEGGGGGGFGLARIRHRLELLGGCMTIVSAPGQGTQVTLAVRLALADQSTSPLPLAQALPAPPPTQLPPTPGRARPLRVLLVDDHQVVRQALAQFLRAEADLTVVGEAGTGTAAVALAHQLMPDVVLMDINMPEMNGIDATRAIHAAFPAMRVIGLSMHDRGDQQAAMQAAGAVAYVSKAGPAETLLAAIRGGR